MALPQPKGKQLEVLDLKPEGHNVVLGTAGSGKQLWLFIEQFILPLWMIRKK